MPLPPDIDSKIRTRFGTLISEGEELVLILDRCHTRNDFPPDYDTRFFSLKTSFLSLMDYLPRKGDHLAKIADAAHALDYYQLKQLLGFIVGLKNDYEAGMLESLTEIIEANIAADYMGQAEQLLGEGVSGQYDHVPAAVLLGAILEDALRRLCQRQTPPIDTYNPNGSPKTLDPLITDLQKANIFNKAKADQLKSWAKTRNYAAHGEFTEFTRTEVEAMIAGVRNFIADYL